MPPFALAHSYAFSHVGFISRHMAWAARMPTYYCVHFDALMSPLELEI
jgi:hypothetical protein